MIIIFQWKFIGPREVHTGFSDQVRKKSFGQISVGYLQDVPNRKRGANLGFNLSVNHHEKKCAQLLCCVKSLGCCISLKSAFEVNSCFGERVRLCFCLCDGDKMSPKALTGL